MLGRQVGFCQRYPPRWQQPQTGGIRCRTRAPPVRGLAYCRRLSPWQPSARRFRGEQREWWATHIGFLRFGAFGGVSLVDPCLIAHFAEEKAVGTSSSLLMFWTRGPSFSVAAAVAIHSGSARNACQRFSRSAM